VSAHNSFIRANAEGAAFVSAISVVGVARILRELRGWECNSQSRKTLSKRLARAELLIQWQLSHLHSAARPHWQPQLDRLYRLLLLRLAHLHLFEDVSILGECEAILADLQTIWEIQDRENDVHPNLHIDFTLLWAG